MSKKTVKNLSKEDLLYTEVSNKGELKALIEKIALEEEDYIPSEKDPDLWIIHDDYDEIEEDDKSETV